MRYILLLGLLAGCTPEGRVVVSALPAQPFCTRTLGSVECFANPEALPDRPAGLADTPVRTHRQCNALWRSGGIACQLAQPAAP